MNPVPANAASPSSNPGRHALAGCLVALMLLALATGGCATPNPKGFKPLTSVTIENRTIDEIGITAIEVFGRGGFEAKEVSRGMLKFQRHGTAMDSVLYGSWYGGGDMWEIVDVRISPIGTSGAHLVECEARKVSSPGDQVFEEQRRIKGKGRYADLLGELKTRLNQAPVR